MATVLLIEPDPATAALYANSLEHAGFSVETSGPDIDRQTLEPDVVVVGVARLEPSLLRVLAKVTSVPRIVLSSNPGDETRAVEFDCAAVLIRPVLYDELVTQVRRVVKAHRPRIPA